MRARGLSVSFPSFVSASEMTKEEGPFVLSTGESSGQTCLRQVCGHGTASSGKAKRRQGAALQKSRGKAASSPSTSLGTGRPSALLPSFFRASRTGRTPKKATSKATAKATGKAKPRLARPRARNDKGRRALRSLHGRELRTNLPAASLQARHRFQRQGKAASSLPAAGRPPHSKKAEARQRRALRLRSLPTSGQAGQAALQKSRGKAALSCGTL
jgi:hypothetical protein